MASVIADEVANQGLFGSADGVPGTPGSITPAANVPAAPVPAANGPKEWVLDPGVFTQLPERSIQELWFELRTWSWKSLAIVPTVSKKSELDIAEKLVVVGVANTNRRMSLISAEGVGVGDTDRVIAMIRAAEARGDRVIVATDSIIDNPAAAPIIRAVNGAVLSVRLHETDLAEVERAVAIINRSRVIGVVTRGS
jgi:hypothetical protein